MTIDFSGTSPKVQMPGRTESISDRVIQGGAGSRP
jgi:hypothetical protein